MKKILLLLFVSGTTPLLSGCWDRVEINDLAIVTAAAIDKKEKGQVELSIQVFLPNALASGGGQGGGGGSSGGGKITLVRSEKGSTIADALSKLQGRLPRQVFWGQCKVFIFGEKMARSGIQKEMDFLLRHPQIRERAFLFVGKGRGREYLEEQPEMERSSAEFIREVTKTRIGLDITMKDFDVMISGKAHAGALPYLINIINKPYQDKKMKIPETFGTAVFKNDRMVGTISERETRGIIWLRNKIKRYTATVKPENTAGELSLDPVSIKVKLLPIIQNGGWKMNVTVVTEGTVVQNGTKYTIEDPKFIKIVEKAYKKAISQRINLSLQQVQQRMKIDIVGFAEKFYQKYPKQFKKAEDHWEEVFPKISVHIYVDAHIRRQGLITEPGGLPEDEVKHK